jgi:hypothetical protein
MKEKTKNRLVAISGAVVGSILGIALVALGAAAFMYYLSYGF